MKLSLALIVKDELDDIKRILQDYYKFFDDVHIAVDYRLDEFEALKAEYPNLHVYPYKWQNDFSHKRNFLASKLTSDYYFRMDCDDAILNPEKIRGVAERAQEHGISVVLAYYEYSRDENGAINAAHYRETIIKNDPNLYWNKKIHENILPKDPTVNKVVLEDSFRIKHLIDSNHAYESAIRNIQYLLEEYNQDRENTDPRTLAYLGRSFLAVQDYEKAKAFLVRHISKSGWDEDRYMSRLQLAECHLKAGEIQEAQFCVTEAMLEREDYPDAYLKLQEIYFEKQDWRRSIHWGEIGITKKAPDSTMIVDPSAHTWRPALMLAYAYFMLSEYEKANQFFAYVKKCAPNVEFVKKNEKMFSQALDHKRFAEKFLWLVQYLKNTGEHKKIESLFAAVPHDMDDNVYLQVTKNKLLPPKTWADDTVVIFCVEALEEWADPSILNGIGGSEEAVIYLAREFAKRGKKVTVYNGCGALEGTYNGVEYLNNKRFNPRDTFHTIISWRQSIFNYPIKAKNKWVWLHDVFPAVNFPQTHVKSVDKVIVLSEYHKSLIPAYVPEEKIMVSTNGINLEDFVDMGVSRNPHRLIYASSYDRGLEHILDLWPRIKAEVPDAELYIYYGWQNFDRLIDLGDMHLASVKRRIVEKMNQPGVFEMGRVGHKELIAEYQKAGVWVYPCSFEEINCIAAKKAQACGCVPVTTDYAALSETVVSGVKVPGKGGTNNEAFLHYLISVLKDEALQEELRAKVKEHFSEFGWGLVADQWLAHMNPETKTLTTAQIGYVTVEAK